MTIWRIRIACWIPKATKILRICNTYCFSTATIVARTRLNVTLHVHCPYTVIPRLTSGPANEDFFAVFRTRLTNMDSANVCFSGCAR